MPELATAELDKLVAFKAIKNGVFETGKLPSRLKILAWGVNETVKGPVVVDENTAKILTAGQESKGFAEIAIDFEHNTVPGSAEYERTKEPRSVAGYGRPVIVPEDGIYLENIRWTPEGQSMAMNYSDLSPALLNDPATGAVTFIHSVALCRNGAVEGLTFHSASPKKSVAVNFAQYPAWELVRVSPSEVPRGFKKGPGGELVRVPGDSWPERWRKAGGRLYGGRMVASKLDPIWAKLGDSDTFDDATDSDIPPFAYNSGYGWEEVDAETAKELGVPLRRRTKTPSKMPPVDLRNFTAGEERKTMDTKKLALALSMKEDATEDEIMEKLTALAAPKPAEKEQDMEQLTAPLVAQIKALSATVDGLKSQQTDALKAAEKVERDALLDAATKEGKLIPLSAESVAVMPMAQLKEMLNNLKPGMVTLSASTGTKTEQVKVSGIDRVKAYNKQAIEQLNAAKK